MRKISVLFGFAILLFSFSSCSAYLTSVRDFLEVNKTLEVVEEETVEEEIIDFEENELPHSDLHRTADIYFDYSSLKVTSDNESKSLFVKDCADLQSYGMMVEWQYTVDKSKSYVFELPFINTSSNEVKATMYVSRDGKKFISNLFDSGLANVAFEQQEDKVVLTLGTLLLKRLASNNSSSAVLYFYLYDVNDNNQLRDVLILDLNIGDYEPQSKFNKPINNPEINIDIDLLYVNNKQVSVILDSIYNIKFETNRNSVDYSDNVVPILCSIALSDNDTAKKITIKENNNNLSENYSIFETENKKINVSYNLYILDAANDNAEITDFKVYHTLYETYNNKDYITDVIIFNIHLDL